MHTDGQTYLNGKPEVYIFLSTYIFYNFFRDCLDVLLFIQKCINCNIVFLKILSFQIFKDMNSSKVGVLFVKANMFLAGK